MKHMGRLYWITIAHVLFACFTCVRIEILNVKAEGFLPVKWPDDYIGNRKWRWLQDNRERLIEWKSGPYRFKHGLQPDDRIPAEAMNEIIAKVDAELPRRQAVNNLHAVVQSWGLLQYLLIPSGLLCAFILRLRENSRTHSLTALWSGVLLATCGLSMLYRGYFTSLGW